MKLKGLPKIVYLNAKQDSVQNQLMIEHFDHYGIKDYIRHEKKYTTQVKDCLLYTSPSPRDRG